MQFKFIRLFTILMKLTKQTDFRLFNQICGQSLCETNYITLIGFRQARHNYYYY